MGITMVGISWILVVNRAVLWTQKVEKYINRCFMELNDKVRIQLKYYGIMAVIVILLYAVYYVKLIPIWLLVMVSVVAMIILTYIERVEFEEKLDEYDEFYEEPIEEDDDWDYDD
jgi:hypothetical protein